MIEHILIILKIFLAGIISDVPLKVIDNEFKRSVQLEQATAELEASKKGYRSFEEILKNLEEKEEKSLTRGKTLKEAEANVAKIEDTC